MDFIEGIPSSNGYSVILVVIDRLTKYNHFFPIKHSFTTSSIAQVFLDNFVKLHEVPKSIVCDQDKVFTSTFWTEQFKFLKSDLKLNYAYHPQIDPKVMNQMTFICIVVVQYLLSLSMQCSRFKALYGVDPSPGLFPTLRHANHTDVSHILKEHQLFTELLKTQLGKPQNRMKLYANDNRSERSFQVDEHVLLKLQMYTSSFMVNHPFPKLAFKYFGPYKITKKIGSVAYKL
jgi:hypothetical protein